MGTHRNGRALVLGMLGIGIIACLGTVWNYSRSHRATRDAVLQSDGVVFWVEARFAHPEILKPGQRAVVAFDPAPGLRHFGRIESIAADTSVRIGFDEPPRFPAGTGASASVDTIAPIDL